LQEQRQQQQQQRQLQVVGGYAAEVTSSTSGADTAAAGIDKAAVAAPEDGTMQAAASDAGSRPVVRFSGPLPSSSSGLPPLPVPQQQQQASGAAVATVPFHKSSSAGQLQQISELASLDEAGASAITAAMQAAKVMQQWQQQ
jgi:hypothetical protein